jgi:hypothetical protein
LARRWLLRPLLSTVVAEASFLSSHDEAAALLALLLALPLLALLLLALTAWQLVSIVA